MVFRENRLLADDSHDILYIIFFSKIKKDVAEIAICCSLIGALIVKIKGGRFTIACALG